MHGFFPFFSLEAPRDMAQLAHASIKGEWALDAGEDSHHIYQFKTASYEGTLYPLGADLFDKDRYNEVNNYVNT